MLRGDDYTARLIGLTKTVQALNPGRGLYKCGGFVARIADDSLPRCECDAFKADGECIHLDAVAYVLDTQELPA